jgi:tRNA(fMet)-specific endonuclease VapC
MTPILLDTNAYTALRRGDADAVAMVRQAERIGMSVIVLGELVGGFRLGTREEGNRELLRQLLASPRVFVLGVNESVAERYGEIRVALRRLGKPIPTNDVWIAATALEFGYAVYSHDAHFRDVPSLNLVTKVNDL